MARISSCPGNHTGRDMSDMYDGYMYPAPTPWWMLLFERLEPHWWGICAILVAPLVGYAAVRRYKAHCKRSPGNFRLAAISGTVTFLFSFLMWWKGYRDLEGALLIAVSVGTGYPIVVTAIMGIVHRWWPWGYQRLGGSSAGAAKTAADGKKARA